MLGTPETNIGLNNQFTEGLTSLRYAIKVATTVCLSEKKQ